MPFYSPSYKDKLSHTRAFKSEQLYRQTEKTMLFVVYSYLTTLKDIVIDLPEVTNQRDQR